MSKIFRRTLSRIHTQHRHKPGTAPGTLISHEGAAPSKITAIAYNEDDIAERAVRDAEEIRPLLEKWPLVWVNVDGLANVEVLEKLGVIFGLHPLALEDVLNTHQRPKTEDYGDILFVITRMPVLREETLQLEQISMFVGKNFVLTFQESYGDCLDPVRERIRRGPGRRIKFSKSDYLSYAIMDAIVDAYFPVLESYGDRLDVLEDAVVLSPSREILRKAHAIRRDFTHIRHAVWPMREMINAFAADEDVVTEETRPYLRDCQDHVIQVLDILESFRDRAASLLDIYISAITSRTNDIMKVLTIISTIFMPLSFIAGVYGMNFNTEISQWNMPELNWAYGYPFSLALMAVIAIFFLIFFARKGWLGK